MDLRRTARRKKKKALLAQVANSPPKIAMPRYSAATLICLLEVIGAIPTIKTRVNGACSFCDSSYTYDLSNLTHGTFKLHSGTPGSQDPDDSYVTYLVSSPCRSAVF